MAPIVSLTYFAHGQSYSETINPEVTDLNNKIRQKREQAKLLESKQQEYEALLQQKRGERMDLANQIAIIDNHLAKAQLELDGIKVDIEETDLEIKKTTIEIADKQDEIDKQKDHIGSVIRLMYKQGQASSLEILLLHDSFSEFLNQLKYLGDVNGELTQSMRGLSDLKESLEKDRTKQQTKLVEMQKFKKTYEEKLARLSADKDSKGVILAQISDSESQYQTLVLQAKAEQAQANNDITAIERSVRQKLAATNNIQSNPDGLIWPVTKNVVTAYFHDPDYPFRYLFEHPAIDIRAAQGSPVRAATSGYVGRAKDGGMGYSYIMLVHADGLATVYGHVSRILVKEDDYVTQGQIIGLSGAMPGTPGAGKLTSGPHMHFEVRLNGIPVNPLEYLQ